MTDKHSREDLLQLKDLDQTDREEVVAAVNRGITRRDMLTVLGAAGVTAASAGHLFSAAGEVVAATPKRGGTVRMASDLHGPSDTLDPQLFTSSIDYSRGRSLYNLSLIHI